VVREASWDGNRERLTLFHPSPAKHAIQDSGTLGTLFSLFLVFPPAVAFLDAALGIDGIRPRRVIAQADELVSVDATKPNPRTSSSGSVVARLAAARLVSL
jgi:hypothetical protein